MTRRAVLDLGLDTAVIAAAFVVRNAVVIAVLTALVLAAFAST